MFTLLAQPGIHVGGVPQSAVGWGTLSLINAGLAQSKNHSGLLWWAVSLLLGPIATFVIVAILDDRRPLPPIPLMKGQPYDPLE